MGTLAYRSMALPHRVCACSEQWALSECLCVCVCQQLMEILRELSTLESSGERLRLQLWRWPPMLVQRLRLFDDTKLIDELLPTSTATMAMAMAVAEDTQCRTRVDIK